MYERLRILIVDDEPAIVDGLTFRLRAAGYDTIAVDNGRDAAAVALQACPSLILLDRQLPGMDGMDVLKALKLHDRTKHIPVIMLSGCDAGRHDALAAGASAFVTKPYRGEELRQVIASLVRNCEVAVT